MEIFGHTFTKQHVLNKRMALTPAGSDQVLKICSDCSFAKHSRYSVTKVTVSFGETLKSDAPCQGGCDTFKDLPCTLP